MRKEKKNECHVAHCNTDHPFCNWPKSPKSNPCSQTMLHMQKKNLGFDDLNTSGYKMENPFPTSSTIPVGHYVAQLPGVTGNFCRQPYGYKTSAHMSWGDHTPPCGWPHSTALSMSSTAYWQIPLSLQSPHGTVLNQKCHRDQITRGICATNHIFQAQSQSCRCMNRTIHIFASHKHIGWVSFKIMPSAPSQCD